jgi:cysteine-rich repeat protein
LLSFFNVKRLLLAFAALPVLAFGQGSSVVFLDVVGHPHESYIRLLSEQGIVQGYGYGIFRPDILINRAEFLKIVMLSAYGSEVYETGDRRCFRDFQGSEQWFWLHACAAKDRRISDGYPDGTFRGQDPVNLAEALKMIVQAWDVDLPTYVRAPDHWYDPYMVVGSSRGIFDYFPDNPGHLLTRSEMTYLIVRFGEGIATVGRQQSSSSVPSFASQSSARRSSASSSLRAGSCGDGELNTGEMCDDGNVVDGDGCSSICVVVPKPVRHGALLLEQRTLGSVARAAGTRDATFLIFDAAASRQDAWITGLTVRAASGSLNAATGYRLLADLDGDGRVEQIVARGKAQGSRVTFANFQVRVADNGSVRFEIRADLSPNVSGTSLGLAFDTDDEAFVMAVGDADGEDLTGIVVDEDDCTRSLCWIRVRTLPVSVVSVETVGNLRVQSDSIPVGSKLLLAGERSDALLRLAFMATDEDIVVRSLAIDGVPATVDHLEFYESGVGTQITTGRAADCPVLISGRMCTSSHFTVTRDVLRRVLIRAVLKSDAEGAGSDTSLTLTIHDSAGSSHAIEARGTRSGGDLSQNDGDGLAEGEIFVGTAAFGSNASIAGPTHDIVFSKIGTIVHAGVDADETSVPVGAADIGALRFTALQNRNTKNGANDVEIRTLIFTVTASNVELDAGSFRLRNALDSSVEASCSANHATQDITVTCSNIQSSIASSIDPGQSIILTLRASVVDPQVVAGGSTLQARLAGLSDRSTLGTVEWHDGVRLLRWVELPVTTVRSTLYRSR